jgi:hypothetical protein
LEIAPPVGPFVFWAEFILIEFLPALKWVLNPKIFSQNSLNWFLIHVKSPYEWRRCVMDQAIRHALQRKRELEVRKEEVDKEIGEIDLFINLHRKFSGTEQERSDIFVEHPEPARPDATVPAPGRKRGRPADFAEIMERVIMDVGRPLSRNDMVEEIEKRIEIPSDDKPRYLGTILWRHRDRFYNLPRFGYWLAARPYAPAGYSPANTDELAKEFLATLDHDASVSLQYWLGSNQEIPADIDGKMLAISRKRINRDLTEGERLSLRKNLVKSLTQQF